MNRVSQVDSERPTETEKTFEHNSTPRDTTESVPYTEDCEQLDRLK